MELTPVLPTHIDSTMISCFRSCRRKFYNEFILGLRPSLVSIDLHAGAAFSTALEAFYQYYFHTDASTAGAKLAAFQAFEHYWGDIEAPQGSPKTKDAVWLMIEMYINQYPPATDHIQPYFVEGKPTFEFTFAIPLEEAGFPRHPVTGDPFLYCGRFDMLGTYHGAPCIRDEKTTKAAGSTWAEQWDLRSQFIGYKWGAYMSGIPVKWVVIRGIVIQKTNPRILEAVKDYPTHLIIRWYEQLKHDLNQIVECWNTGYWDYNLAESCNQYGRCMFATSCLSATPEAWLEGFVIRRWNPLVKDPVLSALAEKEAA